MNELGLVFYGYNFKTVKKIINNLKKILDKKLFYISASGKEEKTVNEILKKEDNKIFSENEIKIIMFLGFNDDEITKTFHFFSDNKNEIPKPIFCILTIYNINWKFKDLINYLIEEENRFKKIQKNFS